jgi:Carboxymuconolactone decarboxylase family
MNESERQALGETMRRTVLGDEHVDRAQARLTEVNDVFQDFITRYAWGEVWTRPGLSPRIRSFITLAILIALNRETELQDSSVAPQWVSFGRRPNHDRGLETRRGATVRKRWDLSSQGKPLRSFQGKK